MHSTTDGLTRAHETDVVGGEGQVRTLHQALQGVPDLRCKRGRRYPAALVLTLLLVAKMAGEQTIAGIAEWVLHHKERLSQWLPLERIPCANTYRYICAHVDAQALLEAVSVVLGAATAAALLQEQSATHATVAAGPSPPATKCTLRQLACDGKELRGSYRLTDSGVQAAQGVLSIYDVASGRTEAFLPIEGKGFEPKALRTWLTAHSPVHGAARTLSGCLLTADALHTQTAVCRAIRTAGADYLLLVKHNQRQLYEDIGYLFSQLPDF